MGQEGRRDARHSHACLHQRIPGRHPDRSARSRSPNARARRRASEATCPAPRKDRQRWGGQVRHTVEGRRWGVAWNWNGAMRCLTSAVARSGPARCSIRAVTTPACPAAHAIASEVSPYQGTYIAGLTRVEHVCAPKLGSARRGNRARTSRLRAFTSAAASTNKATSGAWPR